MATIETAYEGIKPLLVTVRNSVENENEMQVSLMGWVQCMHVGGEINKTGFRKLFEFLKENADDFKDLKVKKNKILSFLNDFIDIL